MIVLDTHVLIWWVSGADLLSPAARYAIEENIATGSEVLISSISVWEIAVLVQKNRLTLNMELETWLTHITHIDGVRFIPVDNEIAVKASLLPGKFHKDAADRMIVTTARKFAIPLVTKDEKMVTYPYVKTIW